MMLPILTKNSSKSVPRLLRTLSTTIFHPEVIATLSPADVQLKRSFREGTTFDYEEEAVRNFLLGQHEDVRSNLIYCLSFANDESDFRQNFEKLRDERMKEQLSISNGQLRRRVRQEVALPTTLEDALRLSKHAIVITERTAPFKVYNVNRAWEDLCGYSYVESKGQTLGSLLKGPETNQLAATNLIDKLLQGESGGVTLTNYTKIGRRFRNRLRAGPLKDSDGKTTHFVGILQEVHDGL